MGTPLSVFSSGAQVPDHFYCCFCGVGGQVGGWLPGCVWQEGGGFSLTAAFSFLPSPSCCILYEWKALYKQSLI